MSGGRVDRRIGTYLAVTYCSGRNLQLFDLSSLFQEVRALEQDQGDARERLLQSRFSLFQVDVALLFQVGCGTRDIVRVICPRVRWFGF